MPFARLASRRFAAVAFAVSFSAFAQTALKANVVVPATGGAIAGASAVNSATCRAAKVPVDKLIADETSLKAQILAAVAFTGTGVPKELHAFSGRIDRLTKEAR